MMTTNMTIDPGRTTTQHPLSEHATTYYNNNTAADMPVDLKELALSVYFMPKDTLSPMACSIMFRHNHTSCSRDRCRQVVWRRS